MNEERKTILEWLQTLPDDHPKYGNIRERAINNANKILGEALGANAISLGEAVRGFVSWYLTDEGQNYWSEINEEIEAGTLFDYQKQPEITYTEGEGMTVQLPTSEGPVIINRAQYNPWISVKDRLPEKDGACLVYHKSYDTTIRLYNSYHKCWDDEDGDDYYTDQIGGKVTHWMPLPEPPKE